MVCSDARFSVVIQRRQTAMAFKTSAAAIIAGAVDGFANGGIPLDSGRLLNKAAAATLALRQAQGEGENVH